MLHDLLPQCGKQKAKERKYRTVPAIGALEPLERHVITIDVFLESNSLLVQ